MTVTLHQIREVEAAHRTILAAIADLDDLLTETRALVTATQWQSPAAAAYCASATALRDDWVRTCGVLTASGQEVAAVAANLRLEAVVAEVAIGTLVAR